MTTTMVQIIPRDRLKPSPTNPRKQFDAGKLTELAETMKGHGILEPLLVRRARGKENECPLDAMVFEIIAGERRWRAAALAGLEELPCLVKALTDDQVIEVQYIENLQRDDLTALEEAEGFARLIEQKLFSAESLAEKLGRSRSHIFSRLKLARLQGPARTELERGNIPATIGSLAAQLPTVKLQKQFVDEVMKGRGWGREKEPLSFRAAEELLHQEYVRTLNGSFSLEAAELVKGCGPCTTCPKRSGNFPGFSGGSPNVCTDLVCYDGKTKAAGELELKKAQADGGKIIRLKEWEGMGHRSRHDYVDPKQMTCVSGSQIYDKKWTSLLKEKESPMVLAQTSKGVEKLLDVKAATALLEEKGLLKREKRGKSAAEKEAALEERISVAVTQRAMERLVGAMENPVRSQRLEEDFLRLIVRAILKEEVQIYDAYEHAMKRRGIQAVVTQRRGWKEKVKPFLEHLETLTTAGVRGLLAELILGNRAYQGSLIEGERDAEDVTHFERACDLFAVDLKGVEKEVRAEFEGKAAKPAAAVKKEVGGPVKAEPGKKLSEKERRAAANKAVKQWREAHGVKVENGRENGRETRATRA